MNFKAAPKRSRNCLLLLYLILSFSPVAYLQQTQAQTPSSEKLSQEEGQRARKMGLAMLGEMKKTLEEHYYDPKHRGIDLNARFQAAENRIKTLHYYFQVHRVLAQVLLDFNDSHTRLILPPLIHHFDYGFTPQMIGDQCFVVGIKKDSDAEKKGLSVGDQILSIRNLAPTRHNLWQIMLLLHKLDPAKAVELKIKTLAGAETVMTIAATIMDVKEFDAAQKKRKEESKPFKCQEINRELIACKLYSFNVDKNEIDKMMKQVKQHSRLILDLRGNRGGRVSVEEYLTGYLFSHDVKIADVVTRKKTEVRIAKTQKNKSFKGELVVLVDSTSASASEVLARVVQLEKRGRIAGDVTSGAVMTSITVGLFGRLSGLTDYATTQYGMSVTIGDVIMKDGSRIEHVGVIPDEAIVPTALGLAEKGDPILAHVATRMGGKLTSEQAGTFYFMTEKPEERQKPERSN